MRSRRRARPRTLQRHQPRHRSARLPRRGAARRVRAHARAVPGGRVPGAGQVRLQQRRRRRGRSRRRCAGAASSASIRTRRATSCRRRPCTCCPKRCPPRAPCSRPISRPRSTASGTRTCGSAIASRSSAPARSAASSPGSPARVPGCEVELVDTNPRTRDGRRRARRRVRRPRRRAHDADVVVHASGTAAGLARCAGARRFRGDGGRAELVRHPQRRAPARRSVPRRRLTLKSSQVGTVAAAQRARWTHARACSSRCGCSTIRRSTRSITGESRFEELPAVLARLASPRRHSLSSHRLRLNARPMDTRMYTVSVRDHFMIAHSFTGDVFGPRSACTARPMSSTSSSSAARSTPTASSSTSAARRQILHVVLAELNYRNLDEEPAFAGRNTTTEFLARVIFERIAAEIDAGSLGRPRAARRAARDAARIARRMGRVRGRSRLVTCRRSTLVVPGDPHDADRRLRSTTARSSRDCASSAGRRLSTRSTRASRGRRRPRCAAARAQFCANSRRRDRSSSTVSRSGLSGGRSRRSEAAPLVALVHHPLALETGLEPARARSAATPEARALAAVRWSSRPVDRARARPRTACGPSASPSSSPASIRRRSRAARAGRASRCCASPLTCRARGTRCCSRLCPDSRSRLAPHVRRQPRAESADPGGPADAHRRARARAPDHDPRPWIGDPRRGYARADVFVLPTYHEGYGMALAEAVARGLPVVSTRPARSRRRCPRTPACSCRPAIRRLRDALARVIDDAALRARLAEGARRARARLPAWDAACARLAAVLHRTREP